MIQSININNFKKIGSELHLNELDRINYLVGENGAGKSRILNFIKTNQSSDYYIIPEGLSLTAVKRDKKTGGQLLDENMNNTLDELGQKVVYKENIKTETIIHHIKGGKHEDKYEEILYQDDNQITKYGSWLSDGTIYFNNIFRRINEEIHKWQRKNLNNNTLIIIFDEIENFLHPKAQKLIPGKLDIYKKYNIQFFITTHSPFVISAAAEYEDQKVYLIEDGKTRDIFGNLNTEESKNGYYGYECKKVVNDMLGVGFDDFQNSIIICEGTSDGRGAQCEFDERVYNQIFKGLGVTFISSGGGKGDMKNHISVAKKIFEDCLKLSIKDSDGNSQEDLEKIKNAYLEELGLHLNFTKKHDLECYILDECVINHLLGSYIIEGKEISNDFKIHYCELVLKLNNKEYGEDEKGKKLERHHIHNEIYDLVKKEIYDISGNSVSLKPSEIQNLLATIIYNNKDGDCKTIYDELYACIFS